ncbi:hypothetical protein BCR25_18295 [Enterococcus termitis]|uniref:DUF4950 domain-containing protein n=2 Tax=Enterococcus termitis TaxID=332950 RepID=A0A1E5GU07_9ENTE|nr:hypothetical protein BCR25_18295 [Enterococcus termitis]
MSLLMLVGCSSNSSKTTQKEGTKESTVTKKVTKNKQKKKEVTKQSTSSSTLKQSEEQQIGLSDFVGGWGVPQSGNLFFINSDGTYSSATATNASLGDIAFSVNDNKTFLMSTSIGDFVKELDGTLTAKGQNYQYLGNVTMEQFLQNKEDSAVQNPQEPSSSPSAASENNVAGRVAPVDNSENIAEIVSYFDQQRALIINKKREQIQSWKDSGEVEWSDEIINSAFAEFESYLGSSSDFTHLVGNSSQDYIKASIDKRFQHAFDTMIQK